MAFLSPSPLSFRSSAIPLTHSRSNSWHPIRPTRRPRAFLTASIPTPTSTFTDSAPPPASVFKWRPQWYPLALTADLSPTFPTPITLLSERLVIWNSSSTPTPSWSVFRDHCPHRQAALSGGRIDPKTNTLSCGYHGWSFASSGATITVPQSSSSTTFPCAIALHTRTISGMLFATLSPTLPATPPLAPPPSAPVLSSYARTLPFPAHLLTENILDPAHIFFAHHNQLARRENAVPMDIRILSRSDSGFVADYYGGSVVCRYTAPCLVEVNNAAGVRWFYYAVPVDGASCRTIGVTVGPHSLMSRFTPRFVDHLRRNWLVDGDLAILRSQAVELGGAETGFTAAAPCLTTTSDKMIVEFRRFLRRSPSPTLAAPVKEIGRRAMMDREKTHTEVCGSCRVAFERVKSARKASVVFVAVCGLWVCVAEKLRKIGVGREIIVGLWTQLVLLGMAAVAVCAWAALRVFERRFVYVETARKATRGN